MFSTFLDWENKMFYDLHSFFKLDISSETQTLLTKNFINGILENKNARVLYQDNKEEKPSIAITYIFADDHSVLITGSRAGAKEVMLRLASSQVEK